MYRLQQQLQSLYFMVGTYYVTVAMETTSADDLLQKMLYLNFVIELRTKYRLFLPNIIDFEAVLVKFSEKVTTTPLTILH